MTSSLQQSTFTAAFTCLGADCPDTCCKGWGMQLDIPTKERYETQAPELLEAITSGEAEFIMRRDPVTDFCVKFEGGLCGIHKNYGTAFLGDACHFYPRISRTLGDQAIMTAALSCPEIARLTLVEGSSSTLLSADIDRLPSGIKDYLPENISPQQGMELHQAFLTMVEEDDATAERMLSRLASLSRSLDTVSFESWPVAVPFYIRMVDSRLPAVESLAADPFNLLHSLYGLLRATAKSSRPRLEQTLEEMREALACQFNGQSGELLLTEGSLAAAEAMQTKWEAEAGSLQPVLKRWLSAELSMALFPFAGFGNNVSERVTLMAMRFGLFKLGLMSWLVIKRSLPGSEECIRIAQSLSRFLNHLGDPTLSLMICEETGWVREARLRGLIGDVNV